MSIRQRFASVWSGFLGDFSVFPTKSLTGARLHESPMENMNERRA